MYPIKTIDGTYSQHFRYGPFSINWNLTTDKWDCNCGNGYKVSNCIHIKECRRII